MTADGDERNPLDQALDLFVYLPVGLVFELPRAIPAFIARGRRELSGLRGHLKDPSRPIESLHAHAHQTLRALGLAADGGPTPAGGPGTGRSTTAATPATGGNGSAAPEVPLPAPVVPPSSAPVVLAPEAPTGPVIDPDGLAITDYDSLSASQVVPRLESLQADELELIRQYEHVNRGRKTILSKIAQLQVP